MTKSSRIALLGSAALSLVASLGFWRFGASYARSFEVLLVRPADPRPEWIAEPLYASLAGVAFALCLGLACGAVIATARLQPLNVGGRVALGVGGLALAAGGVLLTRSMFNVSQVFSIIAMSEASPDPDQLRSALAEIMPTLHFGLPILCLAPACLLACGLFGFGAPASGNVPAPWWWLYPLSVAIAALFLLLVFVAAIPAASRLPEFFTGDQAFKPSEVASVLQQLFSTGRLAGVLLVIFGLVMANLATLPGSPQQRTPA
jgi:hypothetical protein